ncbi:hypothetical protein BD410DRAFT_798149 [Rickenella mellea]|uniref:Uncharacterized protein n=1 Tax=Rickenella mellea TaxID=50990 RepID=A0A4V3AZL5_9AGAM|nr:hypothetical protein BD410DRAFT_798149 [Rickenella mellea]
MSISVDDLVSSLSSNHIGQEAIDIADLQVQLQQALRYQSQQTNNPAFAPCNTPTARTPSSINWSQLADANRRRRSSIASLASRKNSVDRGNDIAEEAMEEDEEGAVEDILSSPMSAVSHNNPESTSWAYHYAQSGNPHVATSGGCEPISPSHSGSSFASTDPFFAVAQAPQQQSNSFFAQNGRVSQQSPFLTPTQQSQSRAVPFPLTLDTRPRYVATAAGFNG